MNRTIVGILVCALVACSSSEQLEDAGADAEQLEDVGQVDDAGADAEQLEDVGQVDDAGRACSGANPCPWGFVCAFQVDDAGVIVAGFCEASP